MVCLVVWTFLYDLFFSPEDGFFLPQTPLPHLDPLPNLSRVLITSPLPSFSAPSLSTNPHSPVSIRGGCRSFDCQFFPRNFFFSCVAPPPPLSALFFFFSFFCFRPFCHFRQLLFCTLHLVFPIQHYPCNLSLMTFFLFLPPLVR